MTLSLAGRCEESGMLGAIVATSALAVGNRGIWAEAGIGAVLTQHRTDPRLGPQILQHLKRGLSPSEAVRELAQTDPSLGWRQLAVINSTGDCAAYSGVHVTSVSNFVMGRNCVAAGNVLRNTEVVDRMVSAFEAAEGEPFAERLLLAIEDGARAGGEMKPLQSAALLIVRRESFALVDLRVDMGAQPIIALRSLWDAYRPGVENFVLRALQPDDAAGHP